MHTNYRSYRSTRHNALVIEGNPSNNAWLLLDRDNGNPECGHGYVWIFPTRQAARDHKREQNAKPCSARVLGPWRVRDCTSESFKREVNRH